MVAQAGGNVGHHARLVHHHEAKIIGAVVPVHRRRRQPFEPRARHPEDRRAGALGEIDEVGDHRRGGRAAAGAAAGVERAAHLIALGDHGVEHALDLADRGPDPDHAGVHPLLEAVVGQPRDAQELDPIAHLARERDVERRDVPDALGVDRSGRGRAAERQRRQQGELVGGVDAVDVEARVGLGVAQRLCLLEHALEIAPALAHGRQDIVAGAVQDAIDAPDPVAGQALAQGLDDRDAARDRGLEADRHPLRLGQAGELGAVPGEQRLVGGHHRLAGPERRPAERQRRAALAADQLDHQIDLRVGGQRQRVVVPAVAPGRDPALAPPVARRDRHHPQLAAGAQRHQGAVLLEQAQHRAADGAEPGDAQTQRLGHGVQATARGGASWTSAPMASTSSAAGGRARNALMLRAAWRIRCRFSTRASRT